MLPPIGHDYSASSTDLLPHPQRALPFKYRRKSFLLPDHRLSSPDVPYAFSDASASSSPVASSAVLESSEPNSPTDYAHIRTHTSPKKDYYYAHHNSTGFETDNEQDREPFSWSVHTNSKQPLPDFRSPPSSSSLQSYHHSPPPLSPVLPSSHLSLSFHDQSFYTRAPAFSLCDTRSYVPDRPLSSSDDRDFDAELSEDDSDLHFASPSHRRRISFTTSCERDRPIDRPPPPIDRRVLLPSISPRSCSPLERWSHISSFAEQRGHVNRTSRTAFPTASSKQPSMDPSPSVSSLCQSAPIAREKSQIPHPHDEEVTPNMSLTIYPSSPLLASVRGKSVMASESPLSHARRSVPWMSYSPLPPSSPPLPSSPISARSSATAVDVYRSPSLPSSSPILPEVHMINEDKDEKVASKKKEPLKKESPIENAGVFPTSRAVRSASLLALLNPAPDCMPVSSTLGLVEEVKGSVRLPTSAESPRLSCVPPCPATPIHSDIAVPASSPLSPVLSVSPSPQPPRLTDASPLSSPLSTPATPLFLQNSMKEGDEETSVLSSPLSVGSALKDEEVPGPGVGVEEEEEQTVRKTKKRRIDRGDVKARKKGKGRKRPALGTESEEEGDAKVVQKGFVKGHTAKRAVKRSPRVVYSDVESEDDDHAQEASDILPSLPQNEREEEPERTKRKPRGLKRKVNEDDAGTAKRKHSRLSVRASSPAAPTSQAPSRKRKRPLPSTVQQALPSPPCSPSKTLTAEQLKEKLDGLRSRCPVDVKEMEGMVVEALGVARASSLAVESVWAAVKGTRPGLEGMGVKMRVKCTQEDDVAVAEGEMLVDVEEREEVVVLGKKEWLSVVQDVLEYGRMSSGIFGRVESSFKDEHSRPLPPHYFYVPESDPDADRAAIIRSMMPRPAKRTETKKYKQYYWKPLGKVCRWESEDAV